MHEAKEGNIGYLSEGNDDALCRLPRHNELRSRTLASGREVKRCSECGEWVNHLRAEHPADVDANVAEE